MTRAAAALVQLSAATVAAMCCGGCSLMDLGDFGLHCEEQTQCNALNERDGLGDGDCVIWQCRKDKRGCEQRPRDLDGDERLDGVACSDYPGPLDCDDQDLHRSPDLSESCDAKDNDCDGLIDEGVAPELEQHALGNVQAPDFLSYTQDQSDALYVTLGTKGAARGWVVAGEEPREHPVRYALAADPERSDDYACRGLQDLVQCQFTELAVAAVGGELVTAGVNTRSCGSGQLRVGLGNQNDFSMQLGSDAQDSNVEWGVDIVAPCTMTDGVQGARDARIAALDADSSQPKPQALALWLAASQGTDCVDDAPLAAIALWPHADSSGRWLEGGNGGHGETLGTSASCGAPSVTALRAGRNSGYAIGYPRQSNVELIWLPRPGALDASLRALAVHASVPAAEPSHVALALLPEGEPTKDGRGLLVAFRSGETAIGFAPIGWNASGLNPGEPQTLERSAEITAGPVAAYATDGFVADAGDGESAGGWLIVWAERDGQGSHLLALRVADAGGGTMLGAPVALEGSTDPQFPFVCAAGAGGFEYGFVASDGSASQLTLGGLSCPASD